MRKLIKKCFATAFVLLGGLFALPLLAENAYPSKPVTIIVPFPAGGTSDLIGRMVADELTKELHQPFTVLNVGGVGGVTGTEKAARAAPDGYTLLQTGVGQNAVAHGLNPNLGYDSRRDFVHISLVHTGPNVLVVPSNSPFNRFDEFVDFAKRNPNKLSYGYTHGASGHMAMELLRQTISTCVGSKFSPVCTTLHITGIPVAGGGPLLAALTEGKIQMAFLNQDAVIPHIASGKLRALAVTSIFRNPALPNVPTISESGYPAFSALSWSGLSAPQGIPKDVQVKLEAAMVKIMSSPSVKQKMESQGFVIPTLGSYEYNDFLGKEIDRWARVIKVAGIKAAP